MNKKINYRVSKALNRFRHELDEIIESMVSIVFYKYENDILQQNATKLGIKYNKNDEIFQYLNSHKGNNYFYNLLYVNLVSVLEMYFFDIIFENTKNDIYKIEKFVQPTKKVLTDEHDIIEKANNKITRFIFHRIDNVNEEFIKLFDINIIELTNYDDIKKIILVRHKLVHQAGRIGEKKIKVTEIGLINSINKISSWIENIDYYLRNKTPKKRFRNYWYQYEKMMNRFQDSEIYKLYKDDKIYSLYNTNYNNTKYRKHIYI